MTCAARASTDCAAWRSSPMDDDARGALGAVPGFGGTRGATASAPSRRSLALAALVGLVVAAVPSLGAHLLSEQTIRDAGEHARPLIALVLVAPLAAVMAGGPPAARRP